MSNTHWLPPGTYWLAVRTHEGVTLDPGNGIQVEPAHDPNFGEFQAWAKDHEIRDPSYACFVAWGYLRTLSAEERRAIAGDWCGSCGGPRGRACHCEDDE